MEFRSMLELNHEHHLQNRQGPKTGGGGKLAELAVARLAVVAVSPFWNLNYILFHPIKSCDAIG
jgi:hypothetical protein